MSGPCVSDYQNASLYFIMVVYVLGFILSIYRLIEDRNYRKKNDAKYGRISQIFITMEFVFITRIGQFLIYMYLPSKYSGKIELNDELRILSQYLANMLYMTLITFLALSWYDIFMIMNSFASHGEVQNEY